MAGEFIHEMSQKAENSLIHPILLACFIEKSGYFCNAVIRCSSQSLKKNSEFGATAYHPESMFLPSALAPMNFIKYVNLGYCFSRRKSSRLRATAKMEAFDSYLSNFQFSPSFLRISLSVASALTEISVSNGSG